MRSGGIKIKKIAFYLVILVTAAAFIRLKPQLRPAIHLLTNDVHPDLIVRYLKAGSAMRGLIQIIADDKLHAFSAIWDTSKGVLLSKKMFRPLEMEGQKRYGYHPGLRKISFQTGTVDFQRYFEALDTPRLRGILQKLRTPFLVESTFNEYGFRQTDYEDRSRCFEKVLFAGDSFTEGLWTAQSKIFPNLYARRVNETNSGSVCVMNSGTNGYGILEESFVARDFFKKMPYQTLILIPYPNDIDPDQFAVLRGDLPDLDLRWKEYLERLGKLVEFCAEHKIRLVIVPVPPKDQFDMKETLPNFQGKLGHFARERGVDFFDPFETFQKYPLSELYLDWDPHFNESGHRILAEFLGEKLS